ncbi:MULTISPECIES: MaoC/PaaZ C-terminal domain-containing protein [unclassified Virgibacillus]|uniref:MaoC/PaaZ C-terminal domain-containing protein n=1 Tax=unclassified Virgibacillus TaxID=2620237 RepID=UPI0024DE081F|nr:MaoC/PaaZ C-terminal domain-containing protein [Virgibacillus sp. LDC-1]
MIGKKRNLGKQINMLAIGDRYKSVYRIEDKDLLLYLGLTNDANPLYIQHDYASQTSYSKPIVPSVMLCGMISAVISMHLPGPGSHIVKQDMTYPKPVFHYTEITFVVEIISIDHANHMVEISAVGFDEEGDEVISGKMYVCPPHKLNSLTANSLENFF